MQKKKKEVSPFCFRQIARSVKVNGVKIKVREYGSRTNKEQVFFYEVTASDGAYFKTLKKQDALDKFNKLIEFEKRQLTIGN